jgi:hypothetical protein
MIMPVAHTFEETKDGFEIRSESGTIIMICKCGEGSTAFPLGTAQLAKMLGRDGIEVFDPPFPLSDRFSNPNCLTPSDDSFYGWWIHPADYDPVVRMLKEFGAARNRARRLRVGHGGNLRGIVTSLNRALRIAWLKNYMYCAGHFWTGAGIRILAPGWGAKSHALGSRPGAANAALPPNES